MPDTSDTTSLPAANQLLIDGFERVKSVAHQVVKGLGEEALASRPDGQGNSIAWLVWHLARAQDSQIAELTGEKEVWASHGWHDKFDLPLDPASNGYGHSSEEVDMVRASADLLTGYYDAVHAKTIAYLKGIKEEDFDQIVDDNWDPPVTLGIRLISIISDDLQHAGQAAYVRGLL
jgi:uncharacterized damage-inducible protein DinB